MVIFWGSMVGSKGSTLYRGYLEIVFPYSLLTASKSGLRACTIHGRSFTDGDIPDPSIEQATCFFC